MRYSIDTSSLIEGFRTHYPYDVLPSLWEKRLPALIADGHLRATEEVRVELARQDDELLQWVDEYEDFFVPIEEAIQHEVIAILAAHPKLIHVGRGRSGADPFVIALARLNGADCSVVCEEGSGSLTKPRMPDVCAALGVRCIRLVEMIREQGWTFG
jgi:hypothetical protein